LIALNVCRGRRTSGLALKTKVFPRFCEPGLLLKLDKHRIMAKNTHELIVLPVFGRFFRPNSLACGSGDFETLSGKLRAASTPSELLLGKRYPSEPWPGVFGFHSFDPDRISAADLRYTSARESTADWLGSRDARQTTRRACESRANFARALSCAHDARIHFTSPKPRANTTSTKANLSAGPRSKLNVSLRQMAVFDLTQFVSVSRSQSGASLFIAQG
jgi:hypothetical protein